MTRPTRPWDRRMDEAGGGRERQDRGGTFVPPPAAGKDGCGEANASHQDERDEDGQSRWSFTGDLGGDGRVVGAARVLDGARPGALDTRADGGGSQFK